MRAFNTAGPCDPVRHYIIPPESRIPEARRLIDGQAYFVVHAPRQTGKTTALRALARNLTAEGRYAALHVSCEAGEPAGDDFAEAQRIVLNEIVQRAASDLPEALRPPSPWPESTAGALLRNALAAWCRACPRPVVLFLDEVDALVGVGRGRIDLLVRWPYRGPDGRREVQREAIEIKIWRAGRSDPLAQGLQQLDAYLTRLGLDHGTLVVFDRRPEAAPIESRTRFEATQTPSGRAVRLLRA